MIKEFIRKHVSDFTDSNGEIDSLGLIELVQKEFALNPQSAEEYVNEFLESE